MNAYITDTEQWTVINALRTAAEVYDTHAKAVGISKETVSLANQFKRQAADARILADNLENR